MLSITHMAMSEYLSMSAADNRFSKVVIGS